MKYKVGDWVFRLPLISYDSDVVLRKIEHIDEIIYIFNGKHRSKTIESIDRLTYLAPKLILILKGIDTTQQLW